MSFKNVSTSSISSGSAECTRPRYIFNLTLQPSLFRISAVERPHSGLTSGLEKSVFSPDLECLGILLAIAVSHEYRRLFIWVICRKEVLDFVM